MKTYYGLLDLKPKATPVQIQATFRRFIGVYRPTLPIDQLYSDTRFREILNAYLTLHSNELREKYDASLKSSEEIPPPQPYDDYSTEKRQLLLARIAFWRREMVEAVHQIRLALENDPDSADAWGLLGEIYLSVGRIEDGVHAYQRAVSSAPNNSHYAERLNHSREVLEGKAELAVEMSPMDELWREERRQRWLFTLLIELLGGAAITYSFVTPINESQLGFLNISWLTVIIQAAGVMLVLLGLGFGRIIQPFEQALVWSTLSAANRGRVGNLPYGITVLAFSAVSMWLGFLSLIGMALMDDEWPTSLSVLIGICVLINLVGVTLLYLGNLPWAEHTIFGGNLLVFAGMIGWFAGSLGTEQYGLE